MRGIIINFTNRIRRSPFIRSVFSIGAGKLIAQLISIGTTLILSRIYFTTDYGDQSIVVSTASIISSFATLGLSSAIMSPKEEEESKNVFMTTFYLCALVSVLCLFIFLTVSPIYKFFNVKGSYIIAVVLMSIYIFITNLNSTLLVFVNKKSLNKTLFFNPIINSLTSLLIALPFGLMKFGYLGFMIAAIFANIATSLHMINVSKPFNSKFKYKTFIITIKRYKEFIFYQFPSNALSTFSGQYPVQFVSHQFSNTVLGLYTMCDRLLKYPITLIATPISISYFRTAAEYKYSNKNLALFTYKLILICLIVALVPTVIVILYGPEMFSFFLGEQWYDAGVLAGIVIYQYVLLFCSQCTSYLRVVLEKQKLNFIFSGIQVVVVVVCAFLGYTLLNSLIGTILFISVGVSLVYSFDMALNFYCLKKYLIKYILLIIMYSIIIYVLMVYSYFSRR